MKDKLEFNSISIGTVGHGYYMVQDSGLVVSHSDTNINCEIKSFEFRKGDMIEFRYSPAEGCLSIYKKTPLGERKG